MFCVRFRPVISLVPQHADLYHRGNTLMGVLNLASLYIRVRDPAMNYPPDHEHAHRPHRKSRLTSLQ
jgi:hypothetical protein